MRTHNAKINGTHMGFLPKGILVSSVVALLTACGGGGGGASSNAGNDVDQTVGGADQVDQVVTEQETIISGNAVKGVVSQGLVNVYLVEEQGGKLVRSSTPLGEPVRTDENGYYEFTIAQEYAGRTVVVEVTADTLTSMKCDTTEGCVNDNGDAVAFGDQFNPGTGFNLRSVASNVEDTVSVHLSPISHMVAVHAESTTDGLTDGNIQSSKTHIEQLLDLDAGAVNLVPADLTAVESYETISKAELEMGVVSAAFLSLVNQPQWDSIEEVIDHVEQVISNEGSFSSQIDSDDENISLDEVFLEASEIASDLVQALPDSRHSDTFAAVSQETTESYNTAAQINDVPALEIIAQPQSVSVLEGEDVLLAVRAAGGQLSYQWRKNGENISGAQSSSLLIREASAANSGSYDVVVSDASGQVASLIALVNVEELIVVDPVTITVQPQDVSADEESATEISVVASGGGELSYQWFKSGVALAGETSNVLTFASLSITDSGEYSVSIANEAGSVHSNNATLSVNELPAPEEDENSEDETAETGSGSSSGDEAGVDAGNGDGTSSDDNSGSDSDNDSGSDSGDSVTILSQPSGLTADEGSSVIFSVEATGTGSIAYQWYKDGVVVSGETSASIILSNITMSDIGSYGVRVSNASSYVNSSTALLRVREAQVEAPVVEIVSQPVGVSLNEGEDLGLTVGASGGDEINYQWYKGSVALDGETSASLFLESVTLADAGSYSVSVSNSDMQIMSSSAVVEVNEVLTIDPVVIVGQPSAGSYEEGANVEITVSATGGGELTYQWYKDGSALSGETGSTLVLNNVLVADSGLYAVAVSNSEGTVNSIDAELEVTKVVAVDPVVITSHPSGVTVDEGASLELSVEATGSGELSYQWFKSGSEISGATTSTLSIAEMQLSDAGSYMVRVSNSEGSEFSNLAIVDVNDIEILKTVELEWVIPEQRADGSDLELNEIDSYVVKYGTDSSDLDQTVLVASGTDTTVVIQDLPQGTYYFEISTVDSDGEQGDASDMISLTL